MPTLTWDDSLKVGNAVMDTDHQEFVELLAACGSADDAEFPALFAALATHLREHLLHEEELMRQYGFPPYPIHKHEHDRVRLELEGIEKRLAAGNLPLARGYVREALPDWFIAHKNTMDSATAGWIKMKGG